MRIALSVMVLILVSCESARRPSEELSQFEIVDSGVREDHGLFCGHGRIQSYSKLSSVNSAEHFDIHAVFQGEGSKLILHTHTRHLKTDLGSQVSIERQGLDLIVSFASPGMRFKVLGTLSDAIQVDDSANFQVEIHDGDRNGLRVLVWQKQLAQAPLSASNAILDSQDLGFSAEKSGVGVRWGLSMQSVCIKSVRRRVAHVQ